MKYGVQIRQMANRMGVESKIEQLYEDTSNFVDYKYSKIRTLFDRLENQVNLILAEDCMNEDEITKMCEIYVEIDYSLIDMFDIIDVTDKIFKKQMDEIGQIYVNACSMFAEGGRSQIIQNAFCFICRYRKNYIDWITEIILDNASALDNRHEDLRSGLEYIFGKMNDEEENEEVEESIISKTRKLYISKSKDLEQIALENGYVFKSQNASSHKKYEHTKTKKCVIIPIHNRDIGLGLSYKIQQEIIANAI